MDRGRRHEIETAGGAELGFAGDFASATGAEHARQATLRPGESSGIAWRIARAVAKGAAAQAAARPVASAHSGRRRFRGTTPCSRARSCPGSLWHALCSDPPDPLRIDRRAPWSRITRSPSASRSCGPRSAAPPGRIRPSPTASWSTPGATASSPTLGLITLHGESLALNERLLKALDGAPALAVRPRPDHPRAGHRRSAAAEGSKAEPADRPLASLLMHIATFDTSTGVTQHLVQVEALVKAETLVQPLLVLTHARPAAWPL